MFLIFVVATICSVGSSGVNIAGGRPRRRLPLSGILELEIFKFGIKLIHRVKNIEFRCLNCKIDFQSDPSNEWPNISSNSSTLTVKLERCRVKYAVNTVSSVQYYQLLRWEGTDKIYLNQKAYISRVKELNAFENFYP